MRLFREYESYAVDAVNMAHILALIEKSNWGTGPTATRIPRHMSAVLQTIEDAGARYGYDCAITALRRRLREYGVEYEIQKGGMS